MVGAKRRKIKHIKNIGKRVTLQTQIKRTKRKIIARKVVSRRGRVSPSQAPLPSQPRTPQGLTLLSSVIKTFKYRIKRRRLRIWFQSGHVYDYFDVPMSVVQQLSLAPSKGRYFYYNIRTSYRFRRVR